MEVNQKDQDVLLVNETGSTKLNVVAGLGEDGMLKVVSPKNENEPNFMRLDKQGNVLDNFMANFVRQYKGPTHLGFFKVSADQVENSSIVMQEMLKDPEVLKKLARIGCTPVFQNASETKARVASELEELQQLYGYK